MSHSRCPETITPHTNGDARANPKKKHLLQSIFSKKDNALGAPKSGDMLELDNCGGTFQMTDGEKASLKDIVDISVGGVIIFTYPKANTPGCSAQACLFRDSYQQLRHLGFSVYGLSRDTPKSNSSFKGKLDLPFSLISNEDGSLINALGFGRPPKGTARGVIIIDKCGRVLASMSGSPDGTVCAVFQLLKSSPKDEPVDEADIIRKAANAAERNGKGMDADAQQMVAEVVAGVAGQVNGAAQKLDTMDNNWACPW